MLFVLPEAALCVALARTEWEIQMRGGARGSVARFANLLRMAILFGLGVIVPILIFLTPYFRAHATGALLRDLVSQVAGRIAGAYKTPDEIVTIVPAIAIVVGAILTARLRGRARWIFTLSFTGLFVTGVVLGFDMKFYNGAAYIAMWSAAYWLIPLLVIAGVAMVMRAAPYSDAQVRAGNALNAASRFAARRAGALEMADTERPGLSAHQPLFLLLAVTALCSLVEFPYSAPVYFCYVAPLSVLCAAALVQRFPRISRELLAAYEAGFLIFVVFAVTPGFIFALGYRSRPDTQKYTIETRRAGGLRVDPESSTIYNRLIALVNAHAGSGEIYAAPDCPEVYFLTSHRNPTPDIYDFLRPESRDAATILALVANPKIHLVVVNTNPPLSPPLPREALVAIARDFPQREMAGPFEICWRR